MGNAKTDDLAAREAQRRASREMLLRPRRFRQDVPIEGLEGVIVTLQSLSQAKRQEIQEQARGDNGEFDAEKAGLLTIVASVVDPELTLDDVKALGEQDGAIIDEIHMHIALMNQMGKVKDLKVESEMTPSSVLDLNKQNGSG